MINLEKIGKVSAPPPLSRGPAPAPHFHPFFLIFQIPPAPPGEVIKIYLSPFKKGGGVRAMIL